MRIEFSSIDLNLFKLVDHRGHFAPYPGGGGCYDYDAIFLLTQESICSTSKHTDLLVKTFNTLINEQNSDGGFCESLYISQKEHLFQEQPLVICNIRDLHSLGGLNTGSIYSRGYIININ